MTDDMSENSKPVPEATSGKTQPQAAPPKEIGGPPGPEPTRHGDWEYNGRCTDF
jgi:hypothetical protein